jgi:hypothetical protein
MKRIHHAMFIAALGLIAAVSASAGDTAGMPMMHTAGAGAGHPMASAATGSRASVAAGPAVRSAAAAVATRPVAATKGAATTRYVLPITRVQYLYPDSKTQMQVWGDHYGICLGGPYDLGKDCTRSVKAVTTDGLFDTTG